MTDVRLVDLEISGTCPSSESSCVSGSSCVIIDVMLADLEISSSTNLGLRLVEPGAPLLFLPGGAAINRPFTVHKHLLECCRTGYKRK